jgi:hypothetical protein
MPVNHLKRNNSPTHNNWNQQIRGDFMSTRGVETLHTVQSKGADFPNVLFNHRAGEFENNFNRLPFMFSHNLAEHHLFEIPRLVELAKTLFTSGAGKVLFQEGKIPFSKKWEDIPRKTLSFIDGIKRIQESGSWVLLKSIQEDPEYKALVESCVNELSSLTGVNLQKEITWLEGYIFIASPESVTPHHIDHEANFLLQVHGEKNLNVCDPSDRSVLTEEEIERYYIGELSAAAYKETSQQKAFVFPLMPGKGVHIPSKGPHWVRNGNEFSVSFSINFCMKELDLSARIYQFNHYLRNLNFQPSPPGKSPLKDRLKVMSLSKMQRGRAENKFELLRQDIQRLDRMFGVAGKLLGRSANKS